MDDDDHLHIGVPKVTGVNAPPGFTSNHVTIAKGYFCKYMCDQTKNSFHQEEVLMNEVFREYAPAVFNKESEEEFHKALYNPDEEYGQLAEYVLNDLIDQGLIIIEQKNGDSIYIGTEKLGILCPQIKSVILPSINELVDEYDVIDKLVREYDEKQKQ